MYCGAARLTTEAMHWGEIENQPQNRYRDCRIHHNFHPRWILSPVSREDRWSVQCVGPDRLPYRDCHRLPEWPTAACRLALLFPRFTTPQNHTSIHQRYHQRPPPPSRPDRRISMANQQTHKSPRPTSPISLPSDTTTPPPLAASFSSTLSSVSDSSPSRISSPAPTVLPAAVARALDRIRNHYQIDASNCFQTRTRSRAEEDTHKDTEEADGWVELSCTHAEWLLFQAYVASLPPSDLSSVIEEKLHYDYFSELSLLVLRICDSRMPTHIHETLMRRIDSHIQAQLTSLSERQREQNHPNDPIVSFIDHIQPWGSPTLFFDRAGATQSDADTDVEPERGQQDGDAQEKGRDRHEPDSSWGSRRPYDPEFPSDYPGVVIEVLCSKKRRQFPHLAEVYLMGTDAAPFIQVVLAIDIELDHSDSGHKARRGKVTAYRRSWQPGEANQPPVCIVQATEHVCA